MNTDNHSGVRLGWLAERTRYVEFECGKCSRQGKYAISRLYREHGNVPVWELFAVIAKGCPRQNPNQHIYDLCGIRCPTLSQVQPLPRVERGDDLL